MGDFPRIFPSQCLSHNTLESCFLWLHTVNFPQVAVLSVCNRNHNNCYYMFAGAHNESSVVRSLLTALLPLCTPDVCNMMIHV